VEIAFGIFIVAVVIDRLIQWLSNREQVKFNSTQLLFNELILRGFAELLTRLKRLESHGLDEETEEGGLDGDRTVPQGGEASPIPDVLRSL
jgi:hypothetical protein